jgi:hypothetical protein
MAWDGAGGLILRSQTPHELVRPSAFINFFQAMTTFPALRLWQISAAVIALFVASFATAQTPLDPPVKPTVNGKFVGNGKNAAIKFVAVEEHEPFGDREAITLVFTEKDPAKSKKPSFDAMFGELGSALKLSVDHDGKIFGCEVAHSAHSKQGFTSLGVIKMVEFKLAGGNVSGHVSTGKELDTFGEKWEVDLKFATPLPAKLRATAGTPGANPPAPKPITGEPGEPQKQEPKPAAGPLIAVGKLPLPKDAAGVDFKATVQQIHFSSPRRVDAVTKEFAASLKQQGWKDGTGSLIGKQNAILKREQGDARLTIMIQPAAAGSVVKIFTEGLDWSGADNATPSASKKATDTPDVDDIEAQVDKALKDALKNLPKEL